MLLVLLVLLLLPVLRSTTNATGTIVAATAAGTKEYY